MKKVALLKKKAFVTSDGRRDSFLSLKLYKNYTITMCAGNSRRYPDQGNEK